MTDRKKDTNTYFIGIIIAASLELFFLLFSFWPLVFVAAIIGGLFCTRLRHGAFTGMIGIVLAWIVYTLANPIMPVLVQIVGSPDLGGIVVIGIWILGAIFGVLGGLMGSAIRILFDPSTIHSTSSM